MKRSIDRKKLWQIFSVYLLALIAAIIGGSGHHAKSTAQAQGETPSSATVNTAK
jgi:hypothetical protein